MLRAVYATYSILSSVVLMNMLIAMMNSTYSDVKSVRLTAWRLESLRMAVWLDTNFSIISRLRLIRFKARFDKWQNRWYMEKVPDKGQSTRSLSDNDAPPSTLEDEKEVEKGGRNGVEEMEVLNKKMEEVKEKMVKMTEEVEKMKEGVGAMKEDVGRVRKEVVKDREADDGQGRREIMDLCGGRMEKVYKGLHGELKNIHELCLEACQLARLHSGGSKK